MKRNFTFFLTSVSAVLAFSANLNAQTPQRFSWQDKQAADQQSLEAEKGSLSCEGRLTDKTSQEIIACLEDPAAKMGSASVLLKGRADCTAYAEEIRKIAWLAKPKNVPGLSREPGWAYPAPDCTTANEVQKHFYLKYHAQTAEIKRATAARQKEKEDRIQADVQAWLDSKTEQAAADMERLSRMGSAPRVAESQNGVKGEIGIREVEKAMIVLYQRETSDDRLLLARGFNLYDPLIGLFGSIVLDDVQDLACEMKSTDRAFCSFRANTERKVDYTRLYGSDEKGQAWATMASLMTPVNYGKNLSLDFTFTANGWRVARISGEELTELIDGPPPTPVDDRPPCIAFTTVDILMNC